MIDKTKLNMLDHNIANYIEDQLNTYPTSICEDLLLILLSSGKLEKFMKDTRLNDLYEISKI